MSKEFEIVREFEVDASPEEVWAAITTGTAGWLWPMEYEPREGGAAPFGGTVAAWDPPRRLTGRTEDAEGVSQQTFNQLDHLIEPREGGGSWVRYVHSGILVEDWDNQYDGANKHTDFYLHTLRQYLTYFTGRAATFATLDAPGASNAPDGLEVVSRGLGLADDAKEGTTVRVEVPGTGPVDAVLDYRNAYFVGLRTDEAMYRVFGRNHFGAPVGVSVHDFAGGADAQKTEDAWRTWLTGLFA
ncbi:SRPBCC domain-containing protein [Streptomyces lunaelactis]|uniref:SRPBCC family protein n=1 Tax=Streptomyces lunaelactis TaxID=1535768 RepID=UPI001584D537|nr:SRPBCC domain-containing protein [Streptomyces lunaelactis]NUK12901.1 SRPBCC domain-containing protein [Streptomyces lunaelactis]NUK21184.1 SRPBCC domain-containing protein [Streptomyces lunaelactis]NUK32931.1 SRPBCC domain-containing protein [Streptomyces lunaelactis]NUK40247.1 SRPBCC domain-containing protein [Streptomyces lunaelactis]NUK50175.1 SRPBCC domain-containing protein [Streptomyces lunaelactis]